MSASFRQRINIKYFMAVYLGLLLLAASLYSGAWPRFFYGLALVAIYSVFDLAWTRLRDRVWYLPVSSWISALVLANVGPPAPVWWLLVILPMAAVAGKHLVHLGKPRHIFNPAGLALLIVTLFTPVIYWWSASLNVQLMIAVGAVGLFILWRQQRYHVTFAFLAVYALGLIILGMVQGAGWQSIPAVLSTGLVNGSLIFFMTVMLIEPVTSNFPTRNGRLAYGALVGIFSVIGIMAASRVPVNDLDPLIVGLLLGDLAASLLFLPRSRPAIVPSVLPSVAP